MKHSGLYVLSKPGEENFSTFRNTTHKDLSNSDKACKNDDSKEPVWKCRYVVTLVSFLIILLANIHTAIMGITIVAMVNNTAVIQNFKEKSQSCLNLVENSTTEDVILQGIKQEGVFIWSPKIQGYILGCFFIGQIIVLMPTSGLAERFGSKPIIVGSLLAVSLLTMLIPPFAWLSASAVIILQILRGFAQGMPLPCVTVLLTNWSPKTERGFLYSIVHSAYFLGPALGFIIGGFVSESPAGWPYVFYSVGGSGLLLTIYVLFFVFESPEEHTRISKAELDFILNQQESKLARRRPKVPWRQLLTSVPVYALFTLSFGTYWEFTQFWTVHSTFLGTILHYPIGENGLLSACPHFIAFLTSTISNWISGYIEKKKIVSVDFLRKFFIFSPAVLYSFCLFGMYMAGCNRDLSIAFSILSMGAGAMACPGQSPVVIDMSPTFSATLCSLSTTIGAFASLILPLMVGYLTDKKQTLEQWNKVFFIGIGVVMLSKIIFVVFGSAKIQPWNFVDDEDGKKEEKQYEIDKKNEETRF